jgi:hypothetical protein
MNIKYTYQQYLDIATPILSADPGISYQGYGDMAANIGLDNPPRILSERACMEFDLSHYWLTMFTPVKRIDVTKADNYFTALEVSRIMSEFYQHFVAVGPMLVAAIYCKVPFEVAGNTNDKILIGIKRSSFKRQQALYDAGLYRHNSIESFSMPNGTVRYD